MTTTLAHRTVDYGTWGKWQLQQPIAPKPAPPTPPTPHDPEPIITLTVSKPVFAVGSIRLQHPGDVRKHAVTGDILRRFHMIGASDKRRVNSGLSWLYELSIEGKTWLLNEQALLEAVQTVKQPAIQFPMSAERLAS